MHGNYIKYANKLVRLSDVLETLTELQHSVNRQVLRYPQKGHESEESLSQLVGKIQGIEAAINKLEYGLGGSMSISPE